jgi:VIT1/CCC1 family predicted Fe2+/Mn2+ transporter
MGTWRPSISEAGSIRSWPARSRANSWRTMPSALMAVMNWVSAASRARPLQAAAASAASFTVGASIPLAIAAAAPPGTMVHFIVGGTLRSLAVVGGAAARAGGPPIARGSIRVMFWGALAMIVTAALGRFVGTDL